MGSAGSRQPFWAFRSFAFCVRAFAAAFEAFTATERLCSAVIVSSLAFPPRRPNSDRYFESNDFAIMETITPRPLRKNHPIFPDNLSGLGANYQDIKTGQASVTSTHLTLTKFAY